MRILILPIVVISLTAAGASAEPPPVSFTLSTGVAHHEQDTLAESQSTWAGEIAAAFGYRIALGRSTELSLGGRLAATRLSYAYAEIGTIFSHYYDFHTIPLDLALAVQYARPPFWVTAWVGKRVTRVDRTNTEYIRSEGTETKQPIEWRSLSISFGVAAGVDLMTLGTHHLGVVLDYARGGRATRDTIVERSDEGDRFSTWTLGVADRW